MNTAFPITDQELVKNYLAGNESCFEMLVKRHKRKVFTTIYLIVNDRYIAEDIFQETFIKVVQKMKTDHYSEEGKFLPWTLRIARNLAIDFFRKTKRRPTIVHQDGEDSAINYIVSTDENHEQFMMRTQSERALRNLIHLLPEEQKEVLVLRHYSDLSFKDIAEVTHVSINTALGRMRYALSNLRKMMIESHINLQ